MLTVSTWRTGKSSERSAAAFWIGINLALRGQWEPASGWLGRAHRLLGGHEGDSAEAGYLKLPTVIEAVMAGDHATAYQTAGEAIEIGQRFSEPDLSALGVFEQGRARILGGDVPEGLQLLDEAMVAVLADELSPIVTGIVYCGVIEALPFGACAAASPPLDRRSHRVV